METKRFWPMVLGALVLMMTTSAFGRSIDPIVSTEWLAENMNTSGLVVLDVRSADAYDAGHIPGSVSEPFVVPFSAWITMPEDSGLLLELPPDAELFDAIGALGIDTQSKVVVVSAPAPGEPVFYGLSSATRVADTLIYAGVTNVAILDGGFDKWVSDGYDTTTDSAAIEPVIFDGEAHPWMFVSTKYVERHKFWANVIDARDADVYFGVTIEPFAPSAGHIPTAMSLPTPWAFNPETLTYLDMTELDAMVSGVLGRRGHPYAEIIVYCGVGGYASVWWYLLTQVLGYRNVKFYDGSAQAWVGAENEMVKYMWR